MAADRSAPTTSGLVFDIKRFAIHDGPGIRSTVFLQGCPLTCAWCHNPEGRTAAPRLWWSAAACMHCNACVSHCPNQALSWRGQRLLIDHDACQACGACVDGCPTTAIAYTTRRMTVAEVMAEVLADRIFYHHSGGGMTCSGGEPLAQAGFAAALCQAARETGLETAIETSLGGDDGAIGRLLPHVDRWIIDRKAPDEPRSRAWTGLSLDDWRRRFQLLLAAGCDPLVRIPLVPGHTDDPAVLATIAADLATIRPGQRVELVPWNPLASGKYERLGWDFPFSVDHAPHDKTTVQLLERTLRAAGLTAV